jgi:Flp pilus assembly protein TadG
MMKAQLSNLSVRRETAAPHHRRRLLRRGESGQSVVEFAIVVPLLCILILAIVDFGKAMNYWQDMTHVANQIARQAAVNSTQLDATSEECAQLETNELRTGSSRVDAAQITITSTRVVGDPVTVEVSATYHWLPVFGGNWTIKGKATMRLEHDLTSGYAGGTCS